MQLCRRREPKGLCELEKHVEVWIVTVICDNVVQVYKIFVCVGHWIDNRFFEIFQNLKPNVAPHIILGPI